MATIISDVVGLLQTSEGYDAYFENWSLSRDLSLQSSVVNMFQASIEGSLECKALLKKCLFPAALASTLTPQKVS